MEPLSAGDPGMVGGYRLRARLGSGGMGRVYLGSSPGGRAVAVKVVHPELARDAEFIRRFRSEVAAAQAVGGIYTAPVHAAGIDDDPPWLATVFVPGPTLQQAVQDHGPLPGPALWRLAIGLAEALAAIHGCGLVHRDLKPTNVLLAEDGPRVIDFGIARALDGTALTGTGTIIGTAPFMSPEQAEGRLVTPEGDIFSFGSVMCFAATGTPPFGDGSAPAVLYRVVHAPPDVAAIPEPLREIVASCLAKRTADRPGLAEVSSTLLALGPGPEDRLASFWPAEVEDIIRRYRAGLDTVLPPETARQPEQAQTVTGHPVPGALHPPAAAAAQPPATDPARPARTTGRRSRALRAVITLLVAGVIASGSYYLAVSGSGRHTPVSSGHTAAGGTTARSSRPPAAALRYGDIVIRLAVTQDCWVNLTDAGTGQQIYMGVLPSGSFKTWTEKQPVTLTLGNPPGAVLTVNGKRVPTNAQQPLTLNLTPPRT